MSARKNATSTTSGILRPAEFARYASLERLACAPMLSPWVENHWLLRWDLPPGRRFVSSTLPHPVCTVSVELGHPRAGVGAERVLVTGVQTTRFDVTTAGFGWVFGVKFRPGGLAALLGLDASTLTDRLMPAGELLPAATLLTLRSLGPDLEPPVAAGRADEALGPLTSTAPDPAYDTVLRIVADVLGDRSVQRVAQIVERHGLSGRHLERLFSRYVGVRPKWLLARYRMHDVVSVLDAGYDGSIADLAAEHGWYDQAHFARDFSALVGVPPSAYRRAGSDAASRLPVPEDRTI